MDKDVQKEIQQLREKLDLAIKQRNGFANNYHTLARIPFQERREIIEDCDQELERVAAEPKARQNY